eukprot:scaffold3416_cov120-Cylindrotheca_fusiformis.AAC.7
MDHVRKSVKNFDCKKNVVFPFDIVQQKQHDITEHFLMIRHYVLALKNRHVLVIQESWELILPKKNNTMLIPFNDIERHFPR